MTVEAVVGLVRALWPVLGDGDEVEVELLPRAERLPVRAMVMYNADAGRWHVLADASLAPRALFVYLAHELGHVHYGDVPKTGTGWGVAVQRSVFLGTRSFVADMGRRFWETDAPRAEASFEERRATLFAVRLVRAWGPFVGVWGRLERVVRETVRRITGEVRSE